MPAWLAPLHASALAGACLFVACGEAALPAQPNPSKTASSPHEAKAEPTPVPPAPALNDEAGALARSMQRARFEADLKMAAAERSLDREQHQKVQDLCAQVFAEAGFSVERSAFSWEGGQGVNVIGVRAGSAPELGAVVLGAHYDHINGCAGADDNASGTAAVLEMARVLGPMSSSRTLIIACWDEEEQGLRGSDAHAQALLDAGTPLSLAVSLDSIASMNPAPGSQKMPPGLDLLFPEQIAALKARGFRGDFIGVLYDHPAARAGSWFEGWAERFELKTLQVDIPSGLRLIDATAQLRRSDHASFWKREVPALLVNDTANFRTPTYHCWEAPDEFDTLDLNFAFKVAQVTVAMVYEELHRPD